MAHVQAYKGKTLLSYQNQIDLINKGGTMSFDSIKASELNGLLSTSGINTITVDSGNFDIPAAAPNYEFKCFKPTGCFVSCQPAEACTSNQQQENKMYHDEYDMPETRTETERKASYFQNELGNSASRKRTALRTTYKLDLQTEPLSPKEMIEWFKDGKFTFTKKQLNDDGSWREPEAYHTWRYDMLNYISWNNPDRDTAGFDTAEKTLDDATRTTERAITAASTGAEMLKALQDFESTTLN